MTIATERELCTLRRIVYGILNVRNGRWYIGQTRHTFWKRYVTGRWWKTSTSDVLRNAYRRYGPEAFEIYILAHGVQTDEEMDTTERRLIQTYNAVFPNGYCFEDGGQTYGQRINARSKAKMSKAHLERRAKEHMLLDASGVECRFANISTFAQERGLNPKQVSNVLRGQCYRYKGYHLSTTHMDRFHQTSVLYTLIAPDGSEHSFYNAAAFCRDHGLCRASVSKVLLGERQNHKGWQLKAASMKPVGYKWKSENNRNKRYERIVLERAGEQHIITNDIQTFCAQNGLTKREVYTLTSGDQKTTHGFRLVSVTYTAAYLVAHPELATL